MDEFQEINRIDIFRTAKINGFINQNIKKKKEYGFHDNNNDKDQHIERIAPIVMENKSKNDIELEKK